MYGEITSFKPLAPEQFTAANVDPFWLSGERHTTALREVNEIVTLTSSDGQAFSGLHLNRDFSEQPTIVRIGSMQSSSTTEQQKYSAEQLAAANPEHPIVTIDLPSHGRSDRLTLSQRTEMVLGKSVAKVANSQAEAVVNYVGDNADQYIVTGDSLGAQLIPDFASKLGLLGLTPVLCVGFEMTGIDSYSSFGSAIKQYITNEGIGHQNYHTGKDNIKLDTAYERFKHELAAAGYDDALYSRFALWQRDPLFVASMFVRPPSSSESSWTALENALNDNPGMAVALVTGGLSKLCDQSLIKPKIAKFNKTYGERLVWDLWPHDSHSMSIAEQQPRAAAYTRARIKELKGV